MLFFFAELVPVGRSWCSDVLGKFHYRCGVAVYRLVHAFGYRVLGFSCEETSLLKLPGILGVIVNVHVAGKRRSLMGLHGFADRK